MGNRICGVGRREAVEDRLTRPQRLARQPSNVDYKKLRKLILSQKLAPCFDALEDPAVDLEECPICFFYYPSLNRSRCCSKGICTECFLQMKPSNAIRPAQCPFCKTSCYAVEYRGARTKEEKELELAEEQKFIEAKIRMLSQESHNVEQTVAVDRICSIADVESPRPCLEEQSTGDLPVTRELTVASMREDTEVDCAVAPDICNPRFEEWDVDLEEIMVMEAIWQSLQDCRVWTNGNPEAFGAGGGVLCGENGEVNQGRPPRPQLDQCEPSSSAACPIPRLVEGDGPQLEAAALIGGNSHTDYRPCEEDSTDESDGTVRDTECLENYSYAEHDPSWGSVRLVEGTHASAGAAALAAEFFSSSADAGTRSSCSSYAHSNSGSPCDSPTFSNPSGVPGFPQLPGLVVERPMMIVMESNA